MKQYLHLIDGKLMVGGERPNIRDYVLCSEDFMIVESAWRESLVEVKNMGVLHGNILFTDRRQNPVKWYRDGQQVETSEPGIIDKII